MKQKPLLFALVGAFSCLVFSSYENGPLAGGAGNRTGSAGTSASCDGSGCHSANSTSTIASLTITEGTSSTPSTTYSSGKTYTVHIGGTCAAAGMSKFGFQVSTVLAANTATQAGTLSVAGGSTAVRTTSGLQIIEHTTPIAGTGSGNSWTYATTATWVAPAAGTGTVKMYLTLNAVNGDGNTSGDKPNHTEVTFAEATTRIDNAAFGNNVNVYPNPATTMINIQQADAANGTYMIHAYDMRGSIIYAQQIEVTNGALNSSINTANWARGLYQLQLLKDGSKKCIPVVIQ